VSDHIWGGYDARGETPATERVDPTERLREELAASYVDRYTPPDFRVDDVDATLAELDRLRAQNAALMRLYSDAQQVAFAMNAVGRTDLYGRERIVAFRSALDAVTALLGDKQD